MGTWSEKIVLIVDDNPVDRLVLKKILTKLKFKSIFEAEDGAVADFKIQNIGATHGRVDLIFLDMKMPKVDGKKLLKDLKINPYTKKAKVIMVSGVAEKDSIEEVLMSGAHDYILKPVEIEVLQRKLDKLIA